MQSSVNPTPAVKILKDRLQRVLILNLEIADWLQVPFTHSASDLLEALQLTRKPKLLGTTTGRRSLRSRSEQISKEDDYWGRIRSRVSPIAGCQLTSAPHFPHFQGVSRSMDSHRQLHNIPSNFASRIRASDRSRSRAPSTRFHQPKPRMERDEEYGEYFGCRGEGV